MPHDHGPIVASIFIRELNCAADPTSKDPVHEKDDHGPGMGIG
jgi:hypothetical protein